MDGRNYKALQGNFIVLRKSFIKKNTWLNKSTFEQTKILKNELSRLSLIPWTQQMKVDKSKYKSWDLSFRETPTLIKLVNIV